jgi:hypothetical protein
MVLLVPVALSAIYRRPGSGDGRCSHRVAGRTLGPELPLQLHEASDPGAIGADVRLDVGGQLADGGQVDAQQLRTPLKRRRDRPARSGSYQASTEIGYRTRVRNRIGNPAY